MWGVISFGFVKLARIIWLTAETDWYYDSVRQRCRNILIGSVVRAGETVVVLGKSRISTQNIKNPEMTVPISLTGFKVGKHWRFRREAFKEWIKQQESLNDPKTKTHKNGIGHNSEEEK